MSVVSSDEVLPIAVHPLARVDSQGDATSDATRCSQYLYENRNLNLSGIMWVCNTKVQYQT